MSIENFKQEVRRATGLSLQTPKDFIRLSNLVHERTGEHISTTTLKRIFGYLNEDIQPRVLTLNLLSRFLGYANYAAYESSRETPQSHAILSEHLTPEMLQEGDRVSLVWAPDRRCVIRFRGAASFEVVEVENTKLRVGDTFTCHLFISHEPLYLDNLVQGDAAPVRYVAGAKDGICFRRL